MILKLKPTLCVCRLMGPMLECLSRKVPEFCRQTHDGLLKKLSPLKSRYCTAVDTNSPSIKQSVVDGK